MELTHQGFSTDFYYRNKMTCVLVLVYPNNRNMKHQRLKSYLLLLVLNYQVDFLGEGRFLSILICFKMFVCMF